jgi:hypothetical protein
MWPVRALLFACWWLLREIEASAVKIGHVTIDRSGPSLVVRVLLPVSKTDITALGATRSHQCLCGTGPKQRICPACIVTDQLEWLLDFYELDSPSDCSEWWADAPLFPNFQAKIVDKLCFVATIEATATNLGLPIVLKNGAKAFTGHSPRASGAIHMASAGLELIKIQLFGRWGSDAFLLYVRGAPLLRMDFLARETQAGLAVFDLRAQIAELHVLALQARRDGFEHASPQAPASTPWLVQEPAALLDGSTATKLSPKARGPSRFVLNELNGGRVHAVADENRAHCGWLFKGGQYTEIENIYKHSLCPVCFDLDPAGAASTTSSDA